MQFLLISKQKPDVAEDALRSLVKKENLEAWAMMKEGVLRSLWYLLPVSADAKGPSGSVCLLECADSVEARRQINRFPLVLNGFVDIELLQLDPFNGFELLFAQGSEG